MEYWDKKELLKKINKNSKVIIGLGDSFTRGDDSCSIEIWEKYNWDLSKVNPHNDIELSNSYNQNCWLNQLCVNYMPDYIPINLGQSGRGNRAAFKEIYFHPEFNLHDKKEVIVIFMLSGLERFDFVHDNFDDHYHFKTMWPRLDDRVKNNPERNLWEGYFEHVWGDRFGVTEMLLLIQEVKLWCKAHNAKLMLLSAFRPDYLKNEFFRLMTLIEGNPLNERTEYIESLINIIDWDNFIRPGGYRCVSDFLCHLEGRDDLIATDLYALSSGFYDYCHSHHKLSEKGYMSKYGHPSYKGHFEIAKELYKAVQENKFINLDFKNFNS